MAMLRTVTGRIGNAFSVAVRNGAARTPAAGWVRSSHKATETDEEFDLRYERFFNRPDIDGWEVRKAINDLHSHDLVAEPKIVIAALKACRRINDFALTVRLLEAIKDKCGPKVGEIWPFMLKEIGPTLKELGIPTPEELGYDKPELAVQDVYDM
jgi:cytochrome c oxidase subunit 5a